MLATPERVETNTMRDPSGDHRGAKSKSLDEISRWWLPFASIVEIWLNAPPSETVYTIVPSSGPAASAGAAPAPAKVASAARTAIAPLRAFTFLPRSPTRTLAGLRALRPLYGRPLRRSTAWEESAAHRRRDRGEAGLAPLVPRHPVPRIPAIAGREQLVAGGEDQPDSTR